MVDSLNEIIIDLTKELKSIDMTVDDPETIQSRKDVSTQWINDAKDKLILIESDIILNDKSLSDNSRMLSEIDINGLQSILTERGELKQNREILASQSKSKAMEIEHAEKMANKFR